MRSTQILLLSILLPALLTCPGKAAVSSQPPASTTEKIFGPVKAGRWYPGERARLDRQVQIYLDAAPSVKNAGQVRALIAPHAGYTWSGPCAAYAYKALLGQNYKRVVLLGPSHSQNFAGFTVLDATHYQTPLGRIPVDRTVAASLRTLRLHRDSPAAWRDEHSLEMQLPFLQKTLQPGFSIVPILIGAGSGDADLQTLADRLNPWMDGQTLLVVSSDFTHYGKSYGYVPFTQDIARRLKEERADPAYQAIASGKQAHFARYLEHTHDTICGRKPIQVLLRMRGDWVAERLRFDSSAATSGDDSNSVTYQSIVFRQPPNSAADSRPRPRTSPAMVSELSAQEKRSLLAVARASLRQHLRHDSSLDDLDSALKNSPGFDLERGAFVTINRRPASPGDPPELRGCIGQMLPRGRLRDVVARLAVDSGTRDPRFSPMQAAELDHVFFEISVLSPMKAVDSYRDIVIGTHGMTLQKDGHRAVFLPQVAPEWGWDLEQTLSQLSRKAGLSAGAWRQGARFEVFTADVFSEPPRERR